MVRIAGFLAVVAVVAGCKAATTGYRYPDDLKHPNYVKRSMATREFALKKDAAQLPDAFRLLMDREAHIRAVAHETIRSLMPNGEDFGYDASLPEPVRAGIVARWKAWWLAQQGAETADG